MPIKQPFSDRGRREPKRLEFITFAKFAHHSQSSVHSLDSTDACSFDKTRSKETNTPQKSQGGCSSHRIPNHNPRSSKSLFLIVHWRKFTEFPLNALISKCGETRGAFLSISCFRSHGGNSQS